MNSYNFSWHQIGQSLTEETENNRKMMVGVGGIENYCRLELVTCTTVQNIGPTYWTTHQVTSLIALHNPNASVSHASSLKQVKMLTWKLKIYSLASVNPQWPRDIFHTIQSGGLSILSLSCKNSSRGSTETFWERLTEVISPQWCGVDSKIFPQFKAMTQTRQS